MHTKRLVGLLVLILVGFAVGAFLVWMRNRPPDRPWVIVPPPNTRDLIAALRENDDGSSRVVSIAPDGTIREPEAQGEPDDREIAWSPDGNRVIFVSNRTTDGSYQLFDWIPDRQNQAYQLTPAGASRSHPCSTQDNRILYASRGMIYRLNYETLVNYTVYPPRKEPGAHRTEEGEVAEHDGRGDDETTDRIEQAWNQISGSLEGDAFERGFLTSDGQFFIGIYSTPRGRALIIQNMRPETEEDVFPVVPLMGEEIEVAMHPSSPLVVVVVKDFRWPFPDRVPEQMKNPDGTIRRPFVNGVFLFDLGGGNPPAIMFQSADGSEALGSPAISPDGTKLALTHYARQETRMAPQGLVVVPVEGGEMRRLVTGGASEPSWSADGDRIAYIKGGDVWTIRADGADAKNLTNGKGRYNSPKFSPKK